MKTAYLINSLEGGGAERVFCQLLKMVSSDRTSDEPLDVILLDDKADVYELPLRVKVYRISRSALPIWPLIQFVKVFMLLRRINPDRTISFLTRANMINAICAWLLSYQSILSERSNTKGRLTGRFSRFKCLIVAWVYRRANKIIAVSEGVANCLLADFSIAPSKIRVLNNPVDGADIQRRAGSEIDKQNNLIDAKIVAVGRLVETKGFVDLIKAYSQSNARCGLAILGEGLQRKELEDLIAELNLVDEIKLLGFVKNPYAVIAQAEIFVLSSHLEGFPNALLESMALAKPVISTDCKDGPREILAMDGALSSGEYRKTEFGLMVSVGDQAAMAKGISYLLENCDSRLSLGASAKVRSEMYSNNKFYQQYLKILDSYGYPHTTLGSHGSHVL